MTGIFYLPNKTLSMPQDLLTSPGQADAHVLWDARCPRSCSARITRPSKVGWTRERVLRCLQPCGAGGFRTATPAPTVVDPLVQWAENRNFAGNPLRREQHPFEVPKPEYQMGFRSMSAPAKGLAETLNDLSGGNEVQPVP